MNQKFLNWTFFSILSFSLWFYLSPEKEGVSLSSSEDQLSQEFSVKLGQKEDLVKEKNRHSLKKKDIYSHHKHQHPVRKRASQKDLPQKKSLIDQLAYYGSAASRLKERLQSGEVTNEEIVLEIEKKLSQIPKHQVSLRQNLIAGLIDLVDLAKQSGQDLAHLSDQLIQISKTEALTPEFVRVPASEASQLDAPEVLAHDGTHQVDEDGQLSANTWMSRFLSVGLLAELNATEGLIEIMNEPNLDEHMKESIQRILESLGS